MTHSETATLRPVLEACRRVWTRPIAQCALCGRCAKRCELYAEGSRGISELARAGLRLVDALLQGAGGASGAGGAGGADAREGDARAGADARAQGRGTPQGDAGAQNPASNERPIDDEALSVAVRSFIERRPDLYGLTRRCSLCNHCTALCPTNVRAVEIVRPWRWLYALAQVLDPADIKSVQVDTEWHIFSVYRAVYGIHYTEFLMLADAAAAAPSDAAAAAPSAATAERALTSSASSSETAASETAASSASSSETAASETAASSASGTGIVDTLFFPGCSLISYAPDLVRKVGAWLSAQGFSWALSDSCCGSPLISHGRPDRARVLRHRIVEQCRAAGIRRVLTVCPGCGDELLSLLAQEGIEVIPLPRLLAEAGVQVSSAAFAPTPATPTLAPAPAPAPSAAPATPTLTFFDSCHDRLQQHGIPIRRLFARLPSVELAHHCRNTLCCGAGGGVSSFDADISDRRLEHLLGEAADAGAGALVTTCPTCTYTFAYKRLLGSTTPVLAHLDCHHYLEYVFETPIDWPTVFSQLQDMWSGEYGEWVCSQLL